MLRVGHAKDTIKCWDALEQSEECGSGLSGTDADALISKIPRHLNREGPSEHDCRLHVGTCPRLLVAELTAHNLLTNVRVRCGIIAVPRGTCLAASD
jgi:hypothetical protein